MENNIQNKSLKFWIKISKFYTDLRDKKYYEVAKQIFRSWTSIWANIAEAQYGSTKKDFVNKMYISLKETEETLYWIDILEQWFGENVDDLRVDCIELKKILITIIKNAKL